MNHIPNSVAVFGGGVEAVDVVLRSILKLKDHEAPVVMLDYTGRGAMVLNNSNQMSLMRHPVLWHNIGDRLQPVALFQVQNCLHFRPLLTRVLQDIRRIYDVDVSDNTLDWAVEAAINASRNGTVGLGTLLKLLSSPETRRWFLDTHKAPTEIGNLVKMLRWALGFASVYAISESGNPSSLVEALSGKGVIWIEIPTEAFEHSEHNLISCLIDAAIEHAVKTVIHNQGKTVHKMTIAHLFPPVGLAAAIPAWVRETAADVRHVAVHVLSKTHSLNQLRLSWAMETSSLWITGGAVPLKNDIHKAWLSSEELTQINQLQLNKVWIRQNFTGKVVTAVIRSPVVNLGVAQILRGQSAKKRKALKVRQASSAFDAITQVTTDGCDLYRKLCDREVLRMGWFKVQTGRKSSRGADNVTIAMFKENIEEELTRLAGELENGSYRCHPLRRLQIPKSDGGKRDIGIAAIRDRVVQSTCLFLLEPIFDPSFSRFSFAFRPRRSAHHALALARSYVNTGRTWAVIADIRKCFDSIDHDLLMNMLIRTIADRDLLNLIRHWLEIDVLEFDELLPVIVGVPQGESLSPLLANIYLDPLDKYLEQAGIVFVRYADDIVILTNSEEEAIAALDAMRVFLTDMLHLELKPAKTNYVPLREGIDFLGFTINDEGIKIRRDRLEDLQHLLCGIIKTLGEPTSTLAQRAESLTRLNAIIRGWRNYFSLPDEQAIAEQLRLADGALEQMAGYYLPHGIRNDPAWICRERLSVVTLPEDGENEQETLHREAVSAGSYPEAQAPAIPGELMVKGETSRSVRGKKTAPVVVITEEQVGTDDISLRDGIIEHGGRLYVLVHGVYLAANGNDLVIKKKKEEIYRQTMSTLCLVFLQGFGITISVDLQLKLAEADIPVVLAPSVGEQMAVLNSVVTSRSHLRGLQVVRRDDADVVGTGLRMIAAKMGNQASVLSYFSKYRKKTEPETGERLMRTAGEIRGLAANVITLDPSLATVRAMAMGLEGHGASLYWRQLNTLVPDNYGFNRRVTKGAQDPINQCLNYMYGMLYGEVWRAVMKAGLDPYFGLMHGSKRDQGSLVFDLIEEFRAPFADRLVMGMLGRGFQPTLGEHGGLKTRTRRQLAVCFLKNWSKKISWRSKRMEPTAILLNQTRSVAKLFNREGDYQPYKMKW